MKRASSKEPLTIRILLVGLLIGIIPACGGSGGSGPSAALTPADAGWLLTTTDPNNITVLPSGEQVSSELVSVGFVPGVTQPTIDGIVAGTGGILTASIPGIGIWIKFTTPKTGAEITAIVDGLRLNPNVATASPDLIYTGSAVFPATTDIEQVGLLSSAEKWGFEQIRMPQAWDLMRTRGWNLGDVVVAVIDTGFDLGHPDLVGTLLSEYNGVPTWDFGDNDGDVSPDLLPSNPSAVSPEHGTKVTGVIAAKINSQGISGVAPTAKVFPIKLFDSKWGNAFNTQIISQGYKLTASIAWATTARVSVINLSLGAKTSTPLSQLPEYKAINQALQQGIVVVAAAGNKNELADTFYPAAIPGVLSVGATDQSDARSIWSGGKASNYSDNPNALWVAAPGTLIYSTTPTYAQPYNYDNGTSLAAPFVSGLAALLRQIDPSLSPWEIAYILRESADTILVTYPPPDVTQHSWRRINAETAMQYLSQPTVRRVSLASDGSQATGPFGTFSFVYPFALSGDGRYVTFCSAASDLVPSDTNGFIDVFVHDRVTGKIRRVSVASDGTEGNGNSQGASISGDGRYVAFWSDATNLVLNDTNAYLDYFVHDLVTGQTERVSVATGGTQGSATAFTSFYPPALSNDGRFVAFVSDQPDLVPGDTNGVSDIFLRDRQLGQTTRISVANAGTEANGTSISPSISEDGTLIAFSSAASNLVSGDSNALDDVFVHDMLTGFTQRVSLGNSGAEANQGASGLGTISGDGRHVTFASYSTNLVVGDTNGFQDIFVRDLLLLRTERVSVGVSGAEALGNSFWPSISRDGRFVVFYSEAQNLVPTDFNASQDVFVHDRSAGRTILISRRRDGFAGNNGSAGGSISPDGRFVAFDSGASDLVPNDTNSIGDIFISTP